MVATTAFFRHDVAMGPETIVWPREPRLAT